ncbi:MAG: hypothetical protein IPG09_08115 [Ignavibacteria bacterium]|jgi:D-glycero-alpha-D-manno-heptose-7-phosphate kinase|nr:hypothetical protein [Ignavibacteria bacterium]
MFLVFTNMARENKVIQTDLGINSVSPEKSKYFLGLRDLSYELLSILESGNLNLNDIGRLLNESWKLKKSTNGHASNPFIDQLYETLKRKGVIGGKILGAGGGGFLLAFTSDSGLREKIKYELYPNFIALDVKFSHKGTEVLWKNF